jgi:capsular polysaccharide biosynthesis protein
MELSFRKISFKTEAGEELISKRAFPALAPFLYLILTVLNFRTRNLEIGLPKIYLSRVFLHELKREFYLSPIRFILRLFFVSFFYSSQYFDDRIYLSVRRKGLISITEQPGISSIPLVGQVNIGLSNRKRMLFAIKFGNAKEIFPSINSLIQKRVIVKVDKIFEPANSLIFPMFHDVILINARNFLDKSGDVVTTAPFELQAYSGLPIQGVVRYNGSDLLMMRRYTSNYHRRFSNHVIFFGYSHMPSNYYHFVVEVLPRILIYKNSSPQINVGLLIGDTPKQILEIYTKALGTPPILLEKPTEIVCFDRIVLARDFRHQKLVDFTDSTLGKNIFANRSLELRKSKLFLEEVFNSEDDIKNQRSDVKAIFLTRKLGSERAPKNIIELEARLLDMGIVTVDTSDLPVSQQIELFRRAKLVVALGGASLTNLMFCKKDTIILALMPDMTPLSRVFWRDYAEVFELKLITLHSVYEKNDKSHEYIVNIKECSKIISVYLKQM